MMGSKIYSEAATFGMICEERMPELLRHFFSDLLAARWVPSFINRRIIIFCASKPGGRPKILHILKVTDFKADAEDGLSCVVEDECTGLSLSVGHCPIAVFDIPVFLWMPLKQTLKWERQRYNGITKDVMSFVISFKTEMSHKEPLYPGALYVLTPNEFLDEFPGEDIRPKKRY